MESRNAFLCYTTRGGFVTQKDVTSVTKMLSKHMHVYVDFIGCRSPDGQSEIEHAISISDVFVILRTPDIFDSYWVRKEIQWARKYNVPEIVLPANFVNSLVSCLALHNSMAVEL